MVTEKKSTVVIAGAGYAGLAAARCAGARQERARGLDQQARLSLAAIPTARSGGQQDRYRHAGLADEVACCRREVEFVKAQITGFDFKTRSVHTDRGDFHYDRLIIALGSQPATFNIPGLSEHALMLKSLANARSIRGHLEMTLSALTRPPDRLPTRS